MPRRKESIFESLIEAPWWMSVIVACIAFIVVRFVVPATMKGSPLLGAAARQLSSYAVWVALFLLIPGGISALLSWRRGELLRGQTGLSTIRNLSWRSLEELVGEAYRKNGFSVVGNSWPGADGGVDLVARKNGERVLIQCKQWKADKVGVRTVREMFGLLNSERANEVHIITSGEFTNEAIDFARNKPIRLIDGPKLVQIVKSAQSNSLNIPPVHESPSEPTAVSSVICPKCGSNMVLRKAAKGPNQGKDFWGCERFPSCRGTREVNTATHSDGFRHIDAGVPNSLAADVKRERA